MVALGISFAFSVFVSSCCLYVASRLIAYKGRLIDFAYIVLAGAILSIVPYVGWLLSFFAIVYLLIKLLDSSIIDAIWVALAASMLRVLIFIGLFA